MEGYSARCLQRQREEPIPSNPTSFGINAQTNGRSPNGTLHRTSQQSETEEDKADHLTRVVEHPIGTPPNGVSKTNQDNVDCDLNEPEDSSQEGDFRDPRFDFLRSFSCEKLTIHFLEACMSGNNAQLKTEIIPWIKNEIESNTLNLSQLTNDEYYSATGLHLALLNKQTETADLLIAEFGKSLILQHYTHPENDGMTSLHIAITQGLSEQIMKMLSHLTDSEIKNFLHAECRGSFFSEKWNISSIPLTLAVLCKIPEIVDILLEADADPRHVSQVNGETILHSLARSSLKSPDVIKEQLEILMDALTKKHKMKNGKEEMKSLLKLTNVDGLKPLEFSLNICASSMVQALFDIPWVYRMPQWNYNPLQVDKYDVTELMQKQEPWNISGLELLAFHTSRRMLQLYKKEPVRTLVDEIWQQFFILHIFEGMAHVVYMVLFTIGVMSKHILGRDIKPVYEEEIWVVIICVIVALRSLVGLFTTIIDLVFYMSPLCRKGEYSPLNNNVEDGDGIRLQNYTNTNDQGVTNASQYEPTIDGLSSNRENVWDLRKWKLLLRCNTYRAFYFMLNTMVLTWSVLRLVGHEQEATVAVFPFLLGWYACIYYTVFFEKIFVFMLMLNSMLLSNVLYFTIALFFIIIGFSLAFHSLQDPTNMEPNDMFPFWRLSNTLFRQMLGLNDIDELMDEMKFPVCARFVMIAFFVIGTVLLLNTLIASMTDTYAEVRDNKVAHWYRVKLQMALQVERPSFRMIKKCLRKSRKLKMNKGRNLLEVYTFNFQK